MEQNIEVSEDQVTITTTKETTIVETHTPAEIKRIVEVLQIQLTEEMEKRQEEINKWQAILDHPDVQYAIKNPVIIESSTPSI